MSKPISVRRTGFQVFGFRVISIFTGLIFLLMMTRTLSTSQFGLWEVILDLVAFASYPAGLVVYWATRDIARGQMVGKTALGMNLGLSAAGMAIYVVFSFFTGSRVGVSELETILLAIFLVPIAYWNQASNAIVNAYNPVVLGYATMTSEVSKLAFAFPLLVLLHTGVDGVIASLIAANFAQCATSTILCRGALALPLDRDAGERWVKRSWLPSLLSIPYYLGVADTFVASLVAGGTTTVGYYQAAFAVATLAGYSYYLGAALYTLLLRGGPGSEEIPTITLDLSLLFGIPMAVGAAALAKPILFLLSPKYILGTTALEILAFSALVNSMSIILDQVLAGRESVDADEKAGFRLLLHSNLFFVFLADIGTSAVYVASVFVIVAAGDASGASTATIIDTWAVAQLVVFSFFVAIRVLRIRRSGRLTLRPAFAKYVAGSLVMGLFLVASSQLLSYSVRSVLFAGDLAVTGLVATAIYFGFLYATDSNFRRMARALLRPLSRPAPT